MRRPIKPEEMTPDLKSEVNDIMENINRRVPGMLPLFARMNEKVETKIQNGDITTITDLDDTMNYETLKKTYQSTIDIPDKSEAQHESQHEAQPNPITPELLAGKTDSQKMAMLITLLNKSGKFDEPITNTHEVLIFRFDKKSVDESNPSPYKTLSDYAQPYMSDKSARRTKAVILMDSPVLPIKQTFYKAYKVIDFTHAPDNYSNISFAGQPIDIPGLSDVSNDLLKDVHAVNRTYVKPIVENFVYPDLDEFKNGFETTDNKPMTLDFDGLSEQSNQQL